MTEYNYTVTTEVQEPGNVVMRKRSFITLVEAVEYLDTKCTLYTRNTFYKAWSIELVEIDTQDTLFLLTSE